MASDLLLTSRGLSFPPCPNFTEPRGLSCTDYFGVLSGRFWSRMELQDHQQTGGPGGRGRQSGKASWRQRHENTNFGTVSLDRPSIPPAQLGTTSPFSGAMTTAASSLASGLACLQCRPCHLPSSHCRQLTQTYKPVQAQPISKPSFQPAQQGPRVSIGFPLHSLPGSSRSQRMKKRTVTYHPCTIPTGSVSVCICVCLYLCVPVCVYVHVKEDDTWVLNDLLTFERPLQESCSSLRLPASLGFPGLLLQVLCCSSRTWI